jgi:hypothetical protein
LGLRSKISGAQYGTKKNDEYRIAIVGDSVTFGEGIKKTEDTFSHVLEDLLNHKQSSIGVRVFNYGVSAYSVKQMAATLQYRMIEIDPDLVLMAIISDDFDLSRTPVVNKYGYTIDLKMSGFWSKDSTLRHFLRNVRLMYLFRDIRYRYFIKQDKQNKFQTEKLPESYEYVKNFKEITEKNNISYSIVLLSLFNKQYENQLLEQFQKDKIRYIDLSSLSKEFSLNQFIASKFDGHPSAMVHKRIGEILTEYVLNEYLHNFAKVEFNY